MPLNINFTENPCVFCKIVVSLSKYSNLKEVAKEKDLKQVAEQQMPVEKSGVSDTSYQRATSNARS